MKAIILFMFLLLSGTAHAQVKQEDFDKLQKDVAAQAAQIKELTSGGGNVKSLDSIKARLAIVNASLDSANKKSDESLKRIGELYDYGGRELHVWDYIFLLPLVLSLLLFLYFRHKKDLRKVLSEAVTDKNAPITKQVVKAASPAQMGTDAAGNAIVVRAAQAQTTTTETTGYEKSASRLALFFSGFVSIIIAISFVTVFLYGYIRGVRTPDYSTLTNVLLVLGIGVVPYAVNQFNQSGTPKPGDQ